MKLKKLASLAVVICLLLCVAIPMSVSGAGVGQYLAQDAETLMYPLDPSLGTAMLVLEPLGSATISVTNGTGSTVSTYGYYGDDQLAADYVLALSKGYDGQVTAVNGEASGTMVVDMFSISNNLEETVYVLITVEAGAGTAPVGTADNPEPLSDNALDWYVDRRFEGATEPYYYSWTAPADGVFSVNMYAAVGLNGDVGWMYSIENTTASTSTDMHYSDDTEVVTTDSISVSKDDVVRIMLVTYDPADMWTIPTGQLTFIPSFSAYGSMDNPYILQPGTVTYADIQDVYFNVTAPTTGKLVITSDATIYDSPNYPTSYEKGEDGTVVIELEAGKLYELEAYMTELPYTATTTVVYTLDGTDAAPIELTNTGDYTANIWAGNWEGVYYTYTASADGLLNVTSASDKAWMVTVNNMPADASSNGAVVEVKKDDVVSIVVSDMNAWGAASEVPFTLSLMPFSTEDAPIQLVEGENDIIVPTAGNAWATITVADGDVVILSGNLSVDTTVKVDGVTCDKDENSNVEIVLAAGEHDLVFSNAAESYAWFELNAETFVPGTEVNPVNINNADQLTSVEVPAAGEAWYAVSSQLNGMILTVVGDENTVVLLNGEAVEGVDGVFTATLDGTPVNALVIYNMGSEAVELLAGLEYAPGTEGNPIVIENANELTSVPAGETYYAVSAQLNGMILNIAASDDVTVTLNGKALEAVAGAYTAVLDGTPVNKLVVTNKGEAEVNASISAALGTSTNPYVVNQPSDLTGADVAAGSANYYAVSSMLNGMILTVDGDAVVTVNGKELKAEGGVYTVELTGTPVNSVVIANNGKEDATYTVSIAYAEGTEGNPISVENTGDLTSAEVEAGSELNYVVSSRLDGTILTVVGDNAYVVVNGEKTEAKNGTVSVVLTAKGATIPVVIGNAGEKAADYTVAIEYPAGTEGNPIAVESISDLTAADVAAGSEVWYAVNSRLDGTVLTVNGDNAYVIVNGEKVEAKNGTVSVALTAKGATISVVIGNSGEEAAEYDVEITYPAGTEGNPIAVESISDLTSADVAAGSEVWYAVNSRLDGTILTVVGDNAYVIVNGEKVEAKDGKVSVTLTAKGATIPVVIGNAGEKDGEYVVAIEYPAGTEGNPIAVGSANDLTSAEVGAGAEIYYAVNSRLDGMVLTVKGEGAYVIVNGEKYEAKDGVVSVALVAEGATISVVIGNAGSEAATYEISLAYAEPDVAPPTADNAVIGLALALMLAAGAAIVVTKKEF